ncbi:hypothetical protein ACWFZ6_24255 [Methylorubrum extorquens]
MKIDVFHICTAHFRTLRNPDAKRLSSIDVFIFFMLPFIIALGSLPLDIKTGKDFYNVSIAFFGIFIALLLNIQVAIFSIFQRNWNKPLDEIMSNAQQQKLDEKKHLLKELNINVSYLIVYSCVALATFIVMFALDAGNKFSAFISTILYFHFILSLLMVVKRTFALFQGEYEIEF